MMEADLGFAGWAGDAKVEIKQLFAESLIRRRQGRSSTNYTPLSSIEPRNFSGRLQHLKNDMKFEI